MNISKKTLKRARAGIHEAHAMFHAACGQKGKTTAHAPGYDDGVAAIILARLDEIERQLPAKRTKRAPTAWQKHVATYLRAGQSIQYAARTWRVRKKVA
jgi:hypothetical protein